MTEIEGIKKNIQDAVALRGTCLSRMIWHSRSRILGLESRVWDRWSGVRSRESWVGGRGGCKDSGFGVTLSRICGDEPEAIASSN
jgi:hypothetical protein